VNLRILVADDQMVIRKLLARIIEENGWTLVGEAADGTEAISLFRRNLPDVVIMDVNMPVMDGLNALKAIKSIDPNACVIMLSSVGTQEKIETAIDLGASAYVLKPVRKEELSKAIKGLSGNR
jgi:two-component system chemotaxis response regulator CheY